MIRFRTAGTIGAALAALLLSVLDQTIVASAATPIAHDLHAGGDGRVPWLIAAYLLASTAVGPLYGKLADRWGPRATFLATLGLFLAGSALCATATSLGELITFRAVQGLGGGGLMTVAIVVLGGVRREAEADGGRPGAGGNLFGAALVGIGLVLGPTLGGQIVEHASWRWLFLINLPLGGLALLVVARCLPTRSPWTTRGPIDGPGAGLLATAATAILLACQWGTSLHAWCQPRLIGLVALTIAALAGFAWRELRAAEPLVPLGIIRDRTVRVIGLLQLLAGIGMAGGTLYITLELQLVDHVSPAGTGLRLIPMAVGLATGSLAGRRLLLGDLAVITRAIAISSVIAALAFAALAVTATATPYGVLAGLLWLLGAGIGVGLGTEIVVLQRTVAPAHLGIATATVRFAEQLGTSLAAAAMGAVYAGRLAAAGAVDPATAVAGAIHPVFAVAAGAMALAAVAALTLPIAVSAPSTPSRPAVR